MSAESLDDGLLRPMLPGVTARRLYNLRRERDRLLGARLFAEPSWDMLLDLYAQEEEGREILASSLWVASCVPAGTAARWLNVLEEAGHVTKIADPEDRGRTHVTLTPETRQALTTYLSSFSVDRLRRLSPVPD